MLGRFMSGGMSGQDNRKVGIQVPEATIQDPMDSWLWTIMLPAQTNRDKAGGIPVRGGKIMALHSNALRLCGCPALQTRRKRGIVSVASDIT